MFCKFRSTPDNGVIAKDSNNRWENCCDCARQINEYLIRNSNETFLTRRGERRFGSGAYLRAGRFSTPYGMDECEINKKLNRASFVPNIHLGKHTKEAKTKRAHKRKLNRKEKED